jgi:hypothetical protein
MSLATETYVEKLRARAGRLSELIHDASEIVRADVQNCMPGVCRNHACRMSYASEAILAPSNLTGPSSKATSGLQ